MRASASGSTDKIRDVSVRIAVKNGTTFTTNNIVSINISRAATDGSFGIGFATSDRLSCELISSVKIPKKTQLTVSVGFGGDMQPLGIFYVDSCTRDGAIINVIAYDIMNQQTKKLVRFGGVPSKGLAALNFPCGIQSILEYIKVYRGLSCNFVCEQFMIAEKPLKNKDATKDEDKYYTVRELLGYIAACHGCNVKINPDGELVFVPFSPATLQLTLSNVIDCTIDDNEPFTVTGILISTANDTNIYIDDVAGSEYDEDNEGVIKCSIPFCTPEIANYMWTRLGNLSYYGGSITLRGSGRVECGDVLAVDNLKYPNDDENYSFCVTNINYEITRQDGFIETLTSSVTRSAADYGGSSSSSSSSGGSGGVGEDLGNGNERFNHYEGQYENKIVGGWGNHVEGIKNLIQGGYGNHVEGENNIVPNSHHAFVTGSNNTVFNSAYNIVGGEHNTVSGSRSLVIGSYNTLTSNGDQSVVCGNSNVADSSNSVLSGTGLLSQYRNQIICGSYNAPDSANILIGNGDGESSRSNAIRLYDTGNAFFSGSIYADNDVSAGRNLSVANDLTVYGTISGRVQIQQSCKLVADYRLEAPEDYTQWKYVDLDERYTGFWICVEPRYARQGSLFSRKTGYLPFFQSVGDAVGMNSIVFDGKTVDHPSTDEFEYQIRLTFILENAGRLKIGHTVGTSLGEVYPSLRIIINGIY